MGSALVGCVTPTLHKVGYSGSVTTFPNAFGAMPVFSPFLRVAQGTRRGYSNRQGKEPGNEAPAIKLAAVE